MKKHLIEHVKQFFKLQIAHAWFHDQIHNLKTMMSVIVMHIFKKMTIYFSIKP
jgi:hypothetical protein